MLLEMLKSKIHRATVTQAELNYVGSITIDESLITASEWGFECAFDTESYATSEGHNCPSFLLVPDVVTVDNMEEKLVTPGYYKVGDDGYLEATNG